MARPRSDISERIQRAARAQFLRHGVDGASLRAIADEAGTSIGMVYYYFPNKDDLFTAVIESTYRGLIASAFSALEPGMPVAQQIASLYARLWRLSDEEFAVVRLVMREAMVSTDRMRRLSPIFAQGHVPLLIGALHEGIDLGALRADLAPMAMLACTMALGMMPVLAWRVAGEKLMPELPLPPPEALGELFANVLLHGIGARPGEMVGTPSMFGGEEAPPKPARQRKSSPGKGQRTSARLRPPAPRRRR